MAKSNKAITKSCPTCSKQVAVACKNCPCGHIFFVARRSAALMSKVKDGSDKRSRSPVVQQQQQVFAESSTVRYRRTERVKRDKPDFYNASEYDKQRRPKSSRQRLTASASEDRDDGNDDQEHVGASIGGRKGRVGRRGKKKDAYDDKKMEDDDHTPPMSAQKQMHMSISLLEVNRKLMAVNPIF